VRAPERDGLVKSVENPAGRRQKRCTLTPDGEKLLADLLAIFDGKGAVMRRLPRILTLAALAACLTTAAAWPMSYWWAAVAGVRGAGVALHAGAYYFSGPEASDRRRFEVELIEGDYTVEKARGEARQRWKPVKLLQRPNRFTFVVVAARVPPLVLAVPAYFGVRRWRRRVRDAARGFEVAPAGRSTGDIGTTTRSG
jgi:DNA-binding MarR family transcriptional regulator